jgi:hypothetical protein
MQKIVKKSATSSRSSTLIVSDSSSDEMTLLMNSNAHTPGVLARRHAARYYFVTGTDTMNIFSIIGVVVVVIIVASYLGVHGLSF